MTKILGNVSINTERCKGCGLCITACPKQLLSMTANLNAKGYNYPAWNEDGGCNGCTFCGISCPDGCITIFRE